MSTCHDVKVTLTADVSVFVAGFTRRAQIVAPDLSTMVLDTPEILAALKAVRVAVERRTELRSTCNEAQAARVALPSGKGSSPVRMHAIRSIEAAFAADDDVTARRADVERAVRAANRGAAEAQIMAAAQSL